jgi:outer membrane immunogenic protein
MMTRKFLYSAAAIVPVIIVSMTAGALAADLPSRNPPPVFVPPVFTWTGFYGGLQVGYQWSDASLQDYSLVTGAPGVTEPTFHEQGVMAGGHIGYLYQINQFVLGIEGDVNGSGYTGNGASVTITPLLYNTTISVEGSVRGRLGIASWDRLLIYATGGVAFAPIRDKYTNGLGLVDDITTTRVGWTIGGGLQYAIDPHWSVRAEYRYTDYGRYNDALIISSGGVLGEQRHETTNVALVGFSYKFDWYTPPRPVVAKY